MGIKRRTFLQVAATSSATLLAGCSGFESIESEGKSTPQDSTPKSQFESADSEEPIPDTIQLLHPERQFVSSDQPDSNTFTVTIQNTGYDGNIAIALFWKPEESVRVDSVESNKVENALYRAEKKSISISTPVNGELLSLLLPRMMPSSTPSVTTLLPNQQRMGPEYGIRVQGGK